MDRVRSVALTSVARGCGFAVLAIFTTMIGLSYAPMLAARTGGILMLGLSLVLVAKARRAPAVDHRATEAWLMLDDAERPPPEYAQRVIAAELIDAYTRFARYTAAAAAGMFLLALVAGATTAA